MLRNFIDRVKKDQVASVARPRGFGASFRRRRVSEGFDGYPEVVFVSPGSLAARNGLEVGDVVIALDGDDACELDAEQFLSAWVAGRNGGRVVLFRDLRVSADSASPVALVLSGKS
jgi:C-terminal processing protease CtpA/Prc